jgi:mono/diheme cytochrome c family protein
MNSKTSIYGFAVIALMSLMSSCQSAEGNSTGSEYMPDMAHSVAYESNVFGYYYNNRWGSEEDLHKMVQPRNPVGGTIARGYAGGMDFHDGNRGVAYKKNGSVPYYYGNTEEDRARAMAEITNNPYPITKTGLENGKALYNIQCAICHGEKGDGAGYLVRDDGGKYPVQPANFLLDDLINASNGRYYHTLIHGRNLMGGYSDKLSYEERWQVIQYIRSLQAASKNLEYSEKVNTLNSTDTPYSVIAAKMKTAQESAVVVDTTKTPAETTAHH